MIMKCIQAVLASQSSPALRLVQTTTLLIYPPSSVNSMIYDLVETPPEYRGFGHFQGGPLAPLGDPKNFKYFFHMAII